ncbi:MAG: DUF4142 domain-containing protein [Deltaproteobacteria bacterium]|nr:DUF4142 domain-containing protein [Deltaproteobacteria bacterium]MBI3296301.1 DUF4142 domain-containing protein [Deltaproteobacteria bacterium]
MRSWIPIAGLIGSITFAVAAFDSSRRQLSDAQWGQLLIASHQASLAVAEQGLAKAQSARIVSFAEVVVDDHKEWLRNTIDVLGKNHIAPRDSEVSHEIVTTENAQVAALSMMDGGPADKAFIKIELANHERFLKMIRENGFAQVKNSALRTYLAEAASEFQKHADEAKLILGGL